MTATGTRIFTAPLETAIGRLWFPGQEISGAESELERTGGVAPSVCEIADHLHYRSPTMARRLLAGLEERGHIRRLPGKDRAIEVLRPVSRFATFTFDRDSKKLQRVRS